MDSLLIYAYQRFVDTTCSECGGYVFECRDPDNQHKYVVDTNGACYRKEALDDVTRAKDYKPKNGQVLRVAPIDDDLISWPTFNRSEHAPRITNDSQDDSSGSKKYCTQ